MKLDPRTFDKSRPIAAAQPMLLCGTKFKTGDAITIAAEPSQKGEVDPDNVLRFWSSGKIVYADKVNPTPILAIEDDLRRTAEIEDHDAGWYLIRAPWLPEAVRVRGEAKVQPKLEELIAEYSKAVEEAPVVEQPESPADVEVPAVEQGGGTE